MEKNSDSSGLQVFDLVSTFSIEPRRLYQILHHEFPVIPIQAIVKLFVLISSFLNPLWQLHLYHKLDLREERKKSNVYKKNSVQFSVGSGKACIPSSPDLRRINFLYTSVSVTYKDRRLRCPRLGAYVSYEP